jgi:hypothetical protein
MHVRLHVQGRRKVVMSIDTPASSVRFSTNEVGRMGSPGPSLAFAGWDGP